MESEFLFKHEFKNWLTETAKISEGSAKSYLSYVSGADKLISVSEKDSSEKFDLFTLLEHEFRKQDFKTIEKTLLFVIDELSRKNADVVFSRAKKTLQNYKSGLYSYLDFLIQQPFSIDNSNEEEIKTIEFQIKDLQVYTDTGKSLVKNKADKEYSKIDLKKNFSFRIKTQDRFYENIFFPIRFINRVFSKKNERGVFENWLNDLLNSITIFLDETKTSFQEITALTISNNKVYITHNGIEKLTYTKLSDNKSLVPFDVLTLRNIAIDHDRSLFDVMNANLTSLPTILQITNELKKHIYGKITYSKLCNASHSDKLDNYIETINTQNLLKELKLIASETNLQLMDGSQNTSKGKK